MNCGRREGSPLAFLISGGVRDIRALKAKVPGGAGPVGEACLAYARDDDVVRGYVVAERNRNHAVCSNAPE